MIHDEKEQYLRMTTAPVAPLICRLAIPTIVSMLVTSIYNMADTYFVSKLGTSATGAVGVVFSLMALIQAVGFMLGMGAAGCISRALGRQDRKLADRLVSTAFFSAVLFGLLITIAGFININGFMKMLGATDTILPFARDYARYILYGAPVMCASFVMNKTLQSEGKALLSMIGIATGGVLNILLDPIFIFVLDLGIAGAAIATLLSQCISFCILLSNFLFGRSILNLRPSNLSLDPKIYGEIIATGLPSFLRQGLASVAGISLNVNAAAYGDAAVAAMSVVNRVFMFVLSAMLGFGQGFQPVAGYNYGAKRYDRLRDAYRFCVRVSMIFLACIACIGFIVAPQVIALFRRDDPVVIAIGAFAFRAQCVTLPLQGLIVISNMMFQSIGRNKPALIIAVSRQGLFFLPLIFILPHFIGLLGVQLSQSISDCVTFLIALALALRFSGILDTLIASQEVQPDSQTQSL